jgi:hypothetical protein
MVTVFYYIYYNVAGVIVTKGAGSLEGVEGGGSMAEAPPRSFGNLLVRWNRITLDFSLVSQKYSVQNSSFPRFLNSNAHIIYLSTTPNSSKVFKRIIVMNI